LKTRQGFVSNSSTTSFCIYGIYSEKGLDADEDYDKYKEKAALGLTTRASPDGGYYYGVSLTKITDDETGRQFKDRVQKTLKDWYGDKIDGLEFGIYEEAWYNG